MAEKLFIIGNGFDLHHGIETRYSDFAAYLRRVDPPTYGIAEDYVVPEEDLWNCLEERLAEVDVDQIEEYAETYLASYGADDWSDSGHHDYEYEIKRICDAISKKLREHFADWVRQIDIPSATAVPVRCIDRRAAYLNFNYTPTLQCLYGVPDHHVLHIHGLATDLNSEIVLGHGWERQPADLRARFTDEETDVRIAGGYRLIDDLLARTFKPTEEILARNSAFFDSLGSVREIFVLGHSMALVDEAYFRAVLDRVDPNANWTVSFYGKPPSEAAEKIGIPSSKVEFKALVDL